LRGWEAADEDVTVLPPPDEFSATEYPWSEHGRERERLRRISTRFALRALAAAALVHITVFGVTQLRARRNPKVIVVQLPGLGTSKVIDLAGGIRTRPSLAPPPIVEKKAAPPPPEKAPPKTEKREGKIKVKKQEPAKKSKAGTGEAAKAPAPVEHEMAAADPGVGAGAPSGVPGIGVDSPNFQYAWYLVQVRNKISSNWVPVGGVPGRTLRVVIHFRILRNGRVEGSYVEEPSGRSEFDRSALSALQSASPLPPLPADFPDDVLGVHFGFTHTP
jgi:TonB family protein